MKKNDFKELIVKEFIAALEQDKLPWTKEWSTGRDKFGSFNYATKRRYGGANRFWLELKSQERGYSTNAFLTFNQCKEKGWELKDAKGMGLPVSFWYPYDTKKKKSLTWQEYNKLLQEDAKKVADVAIFMKIYYVFNARHVSIDDTGRTLEADLLDRMPKREHQEEDIASADAVLNGYCEAEGVNIIYGGDTACYRPLTDDIQLPHRESFSADSFYVSTKAHECAHSTGHSKRLDRKLGAGGFETASYAVEELRAEISASFLCADFGLPQVGKILENSKAYIQSWIEGLKNKPEALLKALDEAEKIASYIKDKGNYAGIFEREVKAS